MRKVTVARMREKYAQTVLTFRITYVYTEDCIKRPTRFAFSYVFILKFVFYMFRTLRRS